ncbi:MAG: Flp pilus assembly secretin CpaC/tetratricopeptide (TPR) repeat protein [Chlamydiales bacterium]|jgi:Flp pilus assembly secretin CpaC/tetratricopeptide (TPR) repeat protein
MRPSLVILALSILLPLSCKSADTAQESSIDPASSQSESTPAATAAPVGAATPTSAAAQVGDADKHALREQRRRSLAAEYLERGQQELDRFDLDAALTSFSSALELDPASDDARAMLGRVRALMGDRFATAGDTLRDETDRAMVKRALARLQFGELAGKGDADAADGHYEDAIQSYRQAQAILSWHPMIASESLDERMLQGKIDEAGQRLERERTERLRNDREQADVTRRATVAADTAKREKKLREYYKLANQAFVNDRFEEAERWTRLILIEDAGNEAATTLLATARDARHQEVDEQSRKLYREQWLRTFEELDTLNVPQTVPLKFNADRWKEVRERKPLTHRSIDPEGLAETAAVMARLEELRFEPKFGGPDGEGTPLDEVRNYMQSLTGVNFWISNAVRDELDEEETAIVLDLPERSVRKVLDIIAATSESLRWKIDDGVVKFVTADELTGGQELVTYSVQDLVRPIPDYPSREINISPSGGLVEPDEDIVEREANVVTVDVLQELISNNIAPESWTTDPANSIRATEIGQLVVNQTPEVHEKIQHLLEDLREATGIMVDIQARFMKVEDNFLEDIGVDFRGLGQPGLGVNGFDFNDFGDASTQNDLGSEIGQGSDLGAFFDEGNDGDVRGRVESLFDDTLGNDQVVSGSGGLSFQWTFLNDLQLELILRAVSKSERVELVTAPRILVHNTARANLSVLNQVAYVQDFDVEIAQAASIADPIIAVIQDGVILDVRPVVSADRRFITLELRPTIAQLKRPIREQITTLGSQNSVTIQLPEVEIQRVRTSIPIPDGGTVLLGGQKISEKQDYQSGVPILSKIPLLSALFERKGNYISNRKLLILLRASIVIPEEAEPTAAELGLAD